MSHSSIEALNAAIETENPFDTTAVVRDQQIWEEGFPDVATLNAHASDAVFQAIEQVRTDQNKVTSIAITAEQGVGKSHIISRIRHRLQQQGGALFIYTCDYGDLNLMNYKFRQVLADSLGKIGSQGVRQWQELATAMANTALRAVKPGCRLFAPTELVTRFSRGGASKARKWANELTKAFLKQNSVSDPDIIKAIFWTLSPAEVTYAIKWLKGQDLAEKKATELGLPNSSQEDRYKESEALNIVLELLSLISQQSALVVCFDQLEAVSVDNAGFTTSQVVCRLVTDLFNRLCQTDSSHGIVFLTTMMPDTWPRKIKILPGGIPDRVSAFSQGKPIDLKHMDGDSIVELVSLWLGQFYQAQNLVPLNPFYPFQEEQLRALAREKPTVRTILRWCQSKFKPGKSPVELAFKQEFEREVTDAMDDNAVLGQALLFNFQRLIDQTVEGVTVKAITENVSTKTRRDPYLNFKIVGEEEGAGVGIGVAVLQDEGGRGLGAGFRRLTEPDTYGIDLTRGCLVRSRSKKLNLHFQRKYVTPLIEQGGEFVDLKEDEIKPLLAIWAVYQKRDEDYKLSEEEINRFIAERGSEKKLGAGNPLLREILSAPSYEVPMMEDEDDSETETEVKDIPDSDEVSDLSDLTENDAALGEDGPDLAELEADSN